MKNNYLIIHGSFSSPFSNWIPYLRENIASKGLDVYTPDFPSGVGFQNYENWSNLLDAYVTSNILNENTIIYAHSIAPIFIIRFLIEHKIKVKRLILVCGFNNYFGINEEYDTVNGSMYYDHPEKIKEFCDDIICLYSDNDPYVKFDAEASFASLVSTKEKIYPGGGHLNSESGYTQFPDLLEYLD